MFIHNIALQAILIKITSRPSARWNFFTVRNTSAGIVGIDNLQSLSNVCHIDFLFFFDV